MKKNKSLQDDWFVLPVEKCLSCGIVMVGTVEYWHDNCPICGAENWADSDSGDVPQRVFLNATHLDRLEAAKIVGLPIGEVRIPIAESDDDED
jgi:hypothetical protein